MSAVENSKQGMTDQDLLDTAAEIVAAGIEVFPISLEQAATKIEKVPLTRHGHQSATLDLGKLKRMITDGRKRLPEGAEMGLGAVLGTADLGTLDYDTKNGGIGDRMLLEHRATYGEAFEGLVYRSISGAENVILGRPEDAGKISNHSPWQDVDVRFDNGWVVPPGVFCSWGSWDWVAGGWEDVESAPEIPAEVMGLLRRAADVASQPAHDDVIETWLDANKLTALPNDIQTQRLKAYCNDLATVAGRNPMLLEALNWVKRENEAIDRRAAFEAIDAAWRARMAADGEPQRSEQAWEVLGRVVGYDLAWNEQREPERAPVTDSEGHEIDSYAPVDLEAWVDGEVEPVVPYGLMVEGLDKGLLYLDRVNGIHGDSGAGKSFIAAQLIMEQADLDESVMIIDLEDNPQPLIERLMQFGMTKQQIVSSVVFVHPQEDFSVANVERLVETIRAKGCVHVIIDSLGEAFGTEGVDENSDVEVTEWIRRVVRRIVDGTGVGVTMIDHITKTADNPLHPSGSKRKRAALTGASWYVKSLVPFSKESGGVLELICGKDRHGNFKRGDAGGKLHMRLDAFGDYALNLEPVAGVPSVEPGEQLSFNDEYDRMVSYMRNLAPGTMLTENGLSSRLRSVGMGMSKTKLKEMLAYGMLQDEIYSEKRTAKNTAREHDHYGVIEGSWGGVEQDPE